MTLEFTEMARPFLSIPVIGLLLAGVAILAHRLARSRGDRVARSS